MADPSRAPHSRRQRGRIPFGDVAAHLGMPNVRLVERLEAKGNWLLKLRDGAAHYVLKLFAAAESQRREYLALKLVEGDRLVPNLFAHGRFPWGTPFILRKWRLGAPFSRVLATGPGTHESTFVLAAAFLRTIPPCRSEPPNLPLSPLAAFLSSGADLESSLAPLAGLLGKGRVQRLARNSADFVTEFRASPALVFAHGDYQPKNMIVMPAGNLSAIIDWEHAAMATRWEDCGQLLRYALDEHSEAAVLSRACPAGESPADWIELCRKADLLSICLNNTRLDSAHLPLWKDAMCGLLDLVEGGSPEAARAAGRDLLAL